ncbi:MAG TPA: DUF58 domain-containing protein [Acidobacteriota bacterium]|nr:DUF58 domain-containing protein [Acidobacteriota bacterium]
MVHVHPGMPQPTRFIDPATLTRISSLELIARTVVEGFIAGLHRSPHLGFSVNFAEYRPYRPGDDIRKIDWKVYGRLDRYFVKEHEGETNTAIHLILDCSRSMTYESQGIRKLEYGQFLAACLGYFAFKQRDGVGFVSYDEDVIDFVPARGSIGHLNTVLHTIERAQAGQMTNFVKPLVSVSERLRRKGIVVLISDLYDEPDRVMKGLRHLAYRGNDLIVFQVLDPAELSFDFSESARFVDMETRAEMHVIPDFVRQEYRRILKDQIAYYEKECQKDRIDFALIDTSQPLDYALFTYLLRRQQLY